MPNGRYNPILIVVDDDPVSLARAAGLLRQAFTSHQVLTCDGTAAPSFVDARRPELVLTDLYMPGTDGFSLIKRLRGSHPDLPVVVMTANGSEEAAVRALRAGAASYITKRQLHDELVETVRAVLAVRANRLRREEIFAHMRSIERHFELPNRSDLVAPVVAEMQWDLRILGVCPDEDLNRFGVALTETLMNAIVHGNLGLPGKLLEQGHAQFRQLVEARQREHPYRERRVFVRFRADREHAVCTVRDEGEGFNPTELPDPTDPDMILRPHGRGLLLVRTFMDEVTFNARGNEITLVKRRAGG